MLLNYTSLPIFQNATRSGNMTLSLKNVIQVHLEHFPKRHQRHNIGSFQTSSLRWECSLYLEGKRNDDAIDEDQCLEKQY